MVLIGVLRDLSHRRLTASLDQWVVLDALELFRNLKEPLGSVLLLCYWEMIRMALEFGSKRVCRIAKMLFKHFLIRSTCGAHMQRCSLSILWRPTIPKCVRWARYAAFGMVRYGQQKHMFTRAAKNQKLLLPTETRILDAKLDGCWPFLQPSHHPFTSPLYIEWLSSLSVSTRQCWTSACWAPNSHSPLESLPISDRSHFKPLIWLTIFESVREIIFTEIFQIQIVLL